jgi:hypothetical protein
LEGHPDTDLHVEAAARYAYAVDLAAGSRETWLELEQPLIVEYPNCVTAPHSLLKVIREAEHDAARFGVALGIDAKVKARPGGKPEAVIGPKVGISPAAKLRAAKSRRFPRITSEVRQYGGRNGPRRARESRQRSLSPREVHPAPPAMVARVTDRL